MEPSLKMPSLNVIQASLKIAAAAVIASGLVLAIGPSTVVTTVAQPVSVIEDRVVGAIDTATDWVSPDWYTAPHVATVTEDDPAWNCLTMGNLRCGPDWVPLPQVIAHQIGLDVDGDQAGCLWLAGATTSYVVCPDGFVTTL